MNERKVLSVKTVQEIYSTYWAEKLLSVRKGIRMHQESSQLRKTPGLVRKSGDRLIRRWGGWQRKSKRKWGNVTEHCAVQVVRDEILGRWIGLPDDVISDIKMAAFLHDFNKKQEITATKKANKKGKSPLTAVKSEQKKAEKMLRKAGFSERVIKLSGAAGGYAPQLLEVQRILDQKTLSNEDWAYLLVHLGDDYSINSAWIRLGIRDNDGNIIQNIIDYRAEDNKAKIAYEKIAREIEREFKDPRFKGKNVFDVMAVVSHQIEIRLVQRIMERIGVKIDPLIIPELVDQHIKNAIAESPYIAKERQKTS